MRFDITKKTPEQVQEPDQIHGFDFSHHNGEIDWTQLKAVAGFVYLKATQGIDFIDERYHDNIRQATELGIPCGSYHFVMPEDSAKEQAKSFLETVGRLESGDLPSVLDTEQPKKRYWQKKLPSRAKRVALISELMDRIAQDQGVMPIIYMSPSFSSEVFGEDKALLKARLWIAHYGVRAPTVPNPWRKAGQTYTFWQSSETGSAPGVKGKVDTDWFNGSVDQLNKLRIPGF